MFAGYLMLFVGIVALLPSSLEASMACSPPAYVINAVTQKAENGRAVCATSPPTETVAADFAILCLDACLKSGSCKHGFNYQSEAKRCELYFDEPNSYQVQPDCSYLKVRCRLSS